MRRTHRLMRAGKEMVSPSASAAVARGVAMTLVGPYRKSMKKK